MDWKKEYRSVWEQLSDKVSLVAIHYVWVNHHSIPIFFWKRWGDFCDSYRSLVWAYLMKQFNVGGWERYSEIIDKFEKGIFVLHCDGEWREYQKDSYHGWFYEKLT